ncbi:SMI1/KNR4 family protein [Chondromyces crocatus]|uniref:Knr4/Smi1-like domain-containing protein n=1 Tax=Chondromyces crocatus TaxID=52 RepID=A0A0K1EJA2_CHOCO|nr:SMI1/KNR4 family protein [Chondromyces crocatus]AKT40658.1 uncharacterized protein CMC5_048140 [Chondromyces crocatus]
MGKAFLEAFNTMVEALRAHPKVEVYEVKVAAPASDAAIARAEAQLKRSLPDDVRAFYLAHDGVFLTWGLAGRAVQDPLSAFEFPDYGAPPGVINLLPIDRVFRRFWVEQSFINWYERPHTAIFGVAAQDADDEQRVRAGLVDSFGNYHHADMVFGPPDQPARMLVAGDHGADLMSSNVSSFATYLEVTLAIWGTDRMRAYKSRRYGRPSVLEGPPMRPSLDEIIARLERDGDDDEGDDEGMSEDEGLDEEGTS